MKEFLITLMALFILVIVFCIFLIIKKIMPLIWLQMKIEKINKYLESLDRYWKEIEDKFKEDETYRNEILSDPLSIALFFYTTDKVNEGSTDFARGLSAEELAALFSSNPELIQSRTEEFIMYRNSISSKEIRHRKKK